MNIEQADRHTLEEYAVFLLNEIDRIAYEQKQLLPKYKHELAAVERELYIRDRKALGVEDG